MAYTQNPQLPRLRMQAVMLVRQGWTTRKVALHLSYSHSTIVRWCQKAPAKGSETIPTLSSRPRSHPRALDPEIVEAILAERRKRGRCAEVVHAELVAQGVVVSLSSVKRTLQRHEMTRNRTKYRRSRIRVPRPAPTCPGALVIQANGITLRHTHVRSPNENGHIERFNRSIQEECVGYQAALKYTSQEQIDEFLDYYNNERRHMGINYQRPAELV